MRGVEESPRPAPARPVLTLVSDPLGDPGGFGAGERHGDGRQGRAAGCSQAPCLTSRRGEVSGDGGDSVCGATAADVRSAGVGVKGDGSTACHPETPRHPETLRRPETGKQPSPSPSPPPGSQLRAGHWAPDPVTPGPCSWEGGGGCLRDGRLAPSGRGRAAGGRGKKAGLQPILQETGTNIIKTISCWAYSGRALF